MHYSDKLGRIIVFLFILFFCNVFFLSCNYFTEPEPFISPNVQASIAKPYVLSNYQLGDTVHGDITITFIPDENPSEINYVQVFNKDEGYAINSYKLPYIFNIDTRYWPNGRHDLHIGVYSKLKGAGLLNLICDTAQYIYTTNLTFRNSPPPPYNLCKSNKYGPHPVVTWHLHVAANVKYCIIRRYDWQHPGPVLSQDTIISTFTNSCSYVDSTAGVLHWNLYYYAYDVGAGNEFGVSFSELIECADSFE